MARPRNLAPYGPAPQAGALAAAYAFGLVRGRGFLDVNKRTGWVAARLFLADHGHRLRFDREEAVKLMLGLAAGTISEADLTEWYNHHLEP